MIDLNVVLAHVSPHGNVQPHLIIINNMLNARDEVTGIVRARMSWE